MSPVFLFRSLPLPPAFCCSDFCRSFNYNRFALSAFSWCCFRFIVSTHFSVAFSLRAFLPVVFFSFRSESNLVEMFSESSWNKDGRLKSNEKQDWIRMEDGGWETQTERDQRRSKVLKELLAEWIVNSQISRCYWSSRRLPWRPKRVTVPRGNHFLGLAISTVGRGERGMQGQKSWNQKGKGESQ